MTFAASAVAGLRTVLVVVFASAALGKLRRSGVTDLAAWVAELDIVPRALRRPAAWALLVTEPALVAALLVPGAAPAGFALAAALLSVFTAVTVRAVARGSTAPCLCFGRSRARLGRRHILRDGLLALAAFAGLAGAGIPQPATPALALGAGVGLLTALGVVFLDDLLFLFGDPDPAA